MSLKRVIVRASGIGAYATSSGVLLDNASARITGSSLIGSNNFAIPCAGLIGAVWELYIKGTTSPPNVILTSTDVQAFNCSATAAVMVSGTLKARWSIFAGSNTSIAVSENGTQASLGGAEIGGAPYVAGGATLTCAQSFSSSYAELGPGCT